MRAGTVAACALVAAATALACSDLFHSTADVLDKCEIDAASCPLDFSALTRVSAEKHAEHACAWLGACESPFGQNAFGPCMIQARLAFDWTVSPGHRVRSEARELWACLAGAQSCDAVRACVLRAAPAPCSSEPPTCVNAGAGTARVACWGGTAHVENCALWGQRCIPGAASTRCGEGATSGLFCMSDGSIGGGDPGSCNGEQARWCGPTGEIGIDCTANGQGLCGVFPDGGDRSWVACLPERDAGVACSPTLSAGCANDIATSCPAEVAETIDCAGLLGSRGSCSDAGLDPPFDWTSACRLDVPCAPDSCDAGTLTSCARGAPMHTDCAASGLGGCRKVDTGDDAGPRAACSPP